MCSGPCYCVLANSAHCTDHVWPQGGGDTRPTNRPGPCVAAVERELAALNARPSSQPLRYVCGWPARPGVCACMSEGVIHLGAGVAMDTVSELEQVGSWHTPQVSPTLLQSTPGAVPTCRVSTQHMRVKRCDRSDSSVPLTALTRLVATSPDATCPLLSSTMAETPTGGGLLVECAHQPFSRRAARWPDALCRARHIT